MHRPAFVDNIDRTRAFLTELSKISEVADVVFPVHPRTRKTIEQLGFKSGAVEFVDPMPYGEFVAQMRSASLVITDSGGIQEDTTALGVPCLTLRNNTERPVTVTDGTNVIHGENCDQLAEVVKARLGVTTVGKRPAPRYWDGRAAERIVDDLIATFSAQSGAADHAPTGDLEARKLGAADHTS